MRVFTKKSLMLKEDDAVYFNNQSGIVDALNKDGDVTVTNDTTQKTIDVPIMTQNNKITKQDLANSDAFKSACDMAKSQPNTNVEVTANKVSGKVTPITNTTATLEEHVVFTKREMNNFLKSL